MVEGTTRTDSSLAPFASRTGRGGPSGPPDSADLPEDERLIGLFLKREREARGLALEEIARLTKIRQGLLAALEAGRYDRLPGEAYVKGFIRCYAQVLDLDPHWVLRQYRELREHRLEMAARAHPAKQAVDRRREWRRRAYAVLNTGLSWLGL